MTGVSEFSFDRLDDLAKEPIVITVAGHANHGKTSVIRTLARDANFGQVADEAGTTKDIKPTRIHLNHRTMMRICDTPGLERASDALAACGRDFTIDDVKDYFQTQPECEQDRIILGQVLQSHAVLYVVDSSQQPKEKYRDEFQLLCRSKVPVIPILNFHEVPETYKERWVDYFERYNCHLHTFYDAHQRSPEDDERLYVRLREVLKSSLHKQFLGAWIHSIQRRQQDADGRSTRAIVDLVWKAAAYRAERLCVGEEKAAEEKAVADDLRRAIEQMESHAHTTIARAYGFTDDDVENIGLGQSAAPIWKMERWNRPRIWQLACLTGIAAGAAGGAVIDLIVGGTSLIFFAICGAAVGLVMGVISAAAYERSSKEEKVTGIVPVELGLFLAERAVALARNLRRRGCAKDGPERVANTPPALQSETVLVLKETIAELQRKTVSLGRFQKTRQGQELSEELLEVIEQELRRPLGRGDELDGHPSK